MSKKYPSQGWNRRTRKIVRRGGFHIILFSIFITSLIVGTSLYTEIKTPQINLYGDFTFRDVSRAMKFVDELPISFTQVTTIDFVDKYKLGGEDSSSVAHYSNALNYIETKTDSPYIMLHEFCHSGFYNSFTTKQRIEWKIISKNSELFVTDYAEEEGYKEDFADSCAFYFMNYLSYCDGEYYCNDTLESIDLSYEKFNFLKENIPDD